MYPSRGTIAGTMPLNVVYCIGFLIAATWRCADGHERSGAYLFIGAGVVGLLALFGWIIRRRHPDPWEPM